jgi:hypothetical protein
MSLLWWCPAKTPCKKLVSLKGELTIPLVLGQGHPGIPDKPGFKVQGDFVCGGTRETQQKSIGGALQSIERIDAQQGNISFSVMRLAA